MFDGTAWLLETSADWHVDPRSNPWQYWYSRVLVIVYNPCSKATTVNESKVILVVHIGIGIQKTKWRDNGDSQCRVHDLGINSKVRAAA